MSSREAKDTMQLTQNWKYSLLTALLIIAPVVTLAVVFVWELGDAVPMRSAVVLLTVTLSLVLICMLVAVSVGHHLARSIRAHELAEIKGRLQIEIDLRTRVEGELRDLEGRLDEQVGEQTAELSAANEALRDELEDRALAEGKRRRTEAKRHQTEKMEVVGSLAGGVAHDLNNILSSVINYPELLLMDLPEEDPLFEPLTTIKGCGEKAAAIVQDLLTMTRRGHAVMKVVDLNAGVKDALTTLECNRILQEHPEIQLVTEIDQTVRNITGSSVHLSKVVLNLVRNACESMPGGGIVQIGVENRSIETTPGNGTDVPEGEYAVITVSDAGSGLSPEDLEHIFEPFYTKKVMGRSGTGLAMAVVWGIVEDHDGYILAHNKEGGGTTFALYFPVTRDEAVEARPMPELESYMGKGETILIVDDMEVQRTLASRMLTLLNYTPVEVTSGEAAVEYLRANHADLVMLDMIMDPGIDGLETYRRILEIKPDQKAIIVSGYSESSRVHDAQALGAGDFVKKPYLLETLGSAIRANL